MLNLIFSELKKGAIALTPNLRMANFVFEQFEYAQIIEQQSAWINPLISAIQPWLTQQIREAEINGLFKGYKLLDSIACKIILESIIQESSEGEYLLRAHPTANAVYEAWNLCIEWQIEFKEFYNYRLTDDLEVFLKWVTLFKDKCEQNNWIDEKTALHLLLKNNTTHFRYPFKKILLIGIQELTPLQQSFINDFKSQGIEIETYKLIHDNSVPYQIELSNSEEELNATALWARKILSENPEASIGIVVPSLEQDRERCQKIFASFFKKDLFNISAPRSLLNFSLIETALLLLEWSKSTIDLNQFTRILLSPYFKTFQLNQELKSWLDLRLKSRGESVITWQTLIYQIKELNQTLNLGGLTNLLEQLDTLFNLKTAFKKRKSALEWVAVFKEWLKICGWPGERILSSEEYQLTMKWDSLLENYILLDKVLGNHSFKEAFTRIYRLSIEISFLPQSLSSPIQILGLLEASGIPFDYMWVIGLNDINWPTQSAPNPFIPLKLQTQRQLPRCNAARELLVAKRMTDLLSRSAKEVIFSFAKNINGEIFQASPLIRDFKKVILYDLLGENARFQTEVQSNILLEEYTDEQAPALDPTEVLKSNATLLKLQSLCPFRAFSEIRLNAKPLPTFDIGLKPNERGEILHQILHVLGNQLNNLEVLTQLPVDELNALIQLFIKKVLAKWKVKKPLSLGEFYLSIEEERLNKIIHLWVNLEKTREFYTIASQEEKTSFIYKNIEFNLRLDRIDELDIHKKQILIDYKTGQSSTQHWFGERPLDPQLPFYAITRPHPPVGMVFGMLNAEGVKLQGITKDADLLPGVQNLNDIRNSHKTDNWESQLMQWKEILFKLIDKFIEGQAYVDPIQNEATCRTCHLKTLCRVHSK
ncbi:MAG: hypothetical protein JWM09_492 [Francisellaceae bacterium]|nr:hypothetical protein [Francisellaceae bacterium]